MNPSVVIIPEQLGKFGRNFKFHFNQRLKNIERSASVPPPPPKKTKTYDDIKEEIERTIPEPSAVDTKLRKKVQFPKDAFFSRQRINSRGRGDYRYKGVTVKV